MPPLLSTIRCVLKFIVYDNKKYTGDREGNISYLNTVREKHMHVISFTVCSRKISHSYGELTCLTTPQNDFLYTPVKIINQNGRSYAVPCAVRTVSVQNDNHGF